MFSFNNDYSEGACKQVLENLIKTNNIQTAGYGLDPFCLGAAELIKTKTNHKDIDVHFIPGGTPCNMLATSLLKPYEAVICVETGHINVHETGAIEAIGHKIISVRGSDGKIKANQIEQVVLDHPDEHMVKPRMVFITNATELGTIYTKQELYNISQVCKKYNLYLYLDGARLGNALTATNNDLTLKDITDLTDIFYIGGTKNGALLGEAMVIKNDDLKANFRYLLKQKGQMLAKGRTIGVSFLTLLEKDLYYALASNANNMAQQLKQFFVKNHIVLYVDTTTNQIFPVMNNKLIAKLRKSYIFQDWLKVDDNYTVVRFVCSWATTQNDINDFIAYFNGVK